jgi:hypothetical protein
MKQGFRRREAPVLVFAGELKRCEMASDASHGDVARAVSLAEVEVECIVLDVLAASVVLD